MVANIINETLQLLDIEHEPITELPCNIPLDGRMRLVVFLTDFGYPSFTVVIDNNSAVKWTDSDIVEYFIDDETQFFIEQYQAALTKTSQQLGFSVSLQAEKIQIYSLVAIINESVSELNRFLTEFTSI